MEQLDVETIAPNEPLVLAAERMPDEAHALKVHYRVTDQGEVRELLIVRRAGRLFALDSLCPHRGGRLAEGPLIDGEHVHCPLHLYKFRLEDGAAVDMPCDPARTFTLHEDGDRVRIDVHVDAP